MKEILFMTFAALLIAAAQAMGAETTGARQLTDTQIARVQPIVSAWKGPAYAALPIVGTADPQPVPSVRPDPRLDQANALAAAAEAQVGPCRFNETETRIEVQQSAFNLSDDALAQCLAAAYAQARYQGIEAQWLERLHEHEAWVIKGGAMTKVAVDARIEKPAARMLWASFATQELLAATRTATAEPGRSVASTKSNTVTAADVHELLGL